MPTPHKFSAATFALKGQIYAIRIGRMKAGVIGKVTRYNWDISPSVRITVTIDLRREEDSHFLLKYPTREHGKKEIVSQRIMLTWRKLHFGGRRWYFICPSTGKNVGNLYLPDGAREFLSQNGHKLPYLSTRLPKWARKHKAAERLHRLLGGNGDWRTYMPRRPKGMKIKTYRRLGNKLRGIVNQIRALEYADQGDLDAPEPI